MAQTYPVYRSLGYNSTMPRKRSAWTWIAVSLIGVPVLYVLSFAPACWWFSETAPSMGSFKFAPMMYWPIGRIAHSYPGSAAYRLISWYALLGIDHVLVPTGLRDGWPEDSASEQVLFLRPDLW